MAERILHGKSYPGSPSGRRLFSSEAARWRWVSSMLKEIEGGIPRWERPMFARIVEIRAEAEARLELAARRLGMEVEQQRWGW